jgi:hypothetical protein
MTVVGFFRTDDSCYRVKTDNILIHCTLINPAFSNTPFYLGAIL